jgi:hypothetical protein
VASSVSGLDGKEIGLEALLALDRASIDGDIRPFATFIAARVNWSLDQAELGLKH